MEIYNIISISIFAILMSSCSKSDSKEFIDTNNKILLLVEDIRTRAGNDHIDDLKNNTKGYGVFISTGELQASGNLFENHQMKWKGSTWYDQTELDGGSMMSWSDNQSLNIYAYYPYKELADPTNMSITVLQDQSTDVGIKASDFLSVQNLSVSKQNNPINLAFSHQFNKFIFNFTDLDGTIINASVKSKTSAKFDINKQQVKSVSTTNQNIKAYIHNNSVEVINIPQSYSMGHELLTITVQEGEATSEHIFKLNKELISTQAEQFIFNVRIDPSYPENILPEPSNVLPWLETDAGDFVANDIYAGLNIINISDFTDTLFHNGSNSYFGYCINTTEYLFMGHYGAQIEIINEQGENVITRGGYLRTGTKSDYLFVRGKGENCKIKFVYVLPGEQTSQKRYTDTLVRANQTLVFSQKEVFVPNIVKVDYNFDYTTRRVSLTIDQPAPIDIEYHIFQWKDRINGEKINKIDVIIPKGSTTFSVDMNSLDPSKGSLLTYDGELKYSCINYLKDGHFIVFGDHETENRYVYIANSQ